MKFSQGDIDPSTGKIFWSKQTSCRNGERWLTSEKFKRKKEAIEAHRKSKRGIALSKLNRNTPEARAKRNLYARYWRDTDTHREEASAYARERRKSNEIACLIDRVRARTNEVFRLRRLTKNGSMEKLLGCSWLELKIHIEKQFKEGMSWANRNLWHIDHKIPLASAINSFHLKVLCRYKNLQPLWSWENQSKGSRI